MCVQELQQLEAAAGGQDRREADIAWKQQFVRALNHVSQRAAQKRAQQDEPDDECRSLAVR